MKMIAQFRCESVRKFPLNSKLLILNGEQNEISILHMIWNKLADNRWAANSMPKYEIFVDISNQLTTMASI